MAVRLLYLSAVGGLAEGRSIRRSRAQGSEGVDVGRDGGEETLSGCEMQSELLGLRLAALAEVERRGLAAALAQLTQP